MSISPAPKVNEFHASEAQVLAEIPGGSRYVSHSELLLRLARHTLGTRQFVNEVTVYYHVNELMKKSLIDQARRRVENARPPKMEMHYRRRVAC